MITRIEALNYRCLKHIAVDVPQFAILIGPNASGKSTLFDVVGYIRDTLNTDLEKAMLARGRNVQELTWLQKHGHFKLAIELKLPGSITGTNKWTHLNYDLWIGPEPFKSDFDEPAILLENCWLSCPSEAFYTYAHEEGERFIASYRNTKSSLLSDTTLHNREPDFFKVLFGYTDDAGPNGILSDECSRLRLYGHRPSPHKSAFATLPEDDTKFPRAIWGKRFLMGNVHTVVLDLRKLHEPGAALHGAKTFRPDGSNIPHLIESLKKDHPDIFRRWLEHVQTVLEDVKDIIVKEREEDRARYLVLVQRNGTKVPSWLVSDGTLRFLALTLLAYHPVATGTYLIEEPENGIHPLAIEAVYQSLSSAYDAQILLATHSPMLLSLAKPEEILCFSRDEEGATQIVKASDHPALRDWKGEENLSVYYASGVLG